MPHQDPNKRRAASRASQRRRRSAAANGGARGRSGADTPKKTSVGEHPDARVRAAFVYYTGVHVRESVSAVGFALGTSLGDEAVVRTQATFAALNTLSDQVPLDLDFLEGTPPEDGQSRH